LNTVHWRSAIRLRRSIGRCGEGDNLYSDGVALDPDTGKLKWHYQFTLNDGTTGIRRRTWCSSIA
jgi:alcohol dehydrogenase (cytochrome c)